MRRRLRAGRLSPGERRLKARARDAERRLDEALAQAEARAASIATLSHEIREPINGVLGMARLLRDTPLDPEQEGYLAAVIEQAEALTTLINDILDLAKIDAGRLDLVPIDFCPGAFFARLRDMLAPRAERKGLRLELEPGARLPALLRGDPGRLRQVIVNLVSNAIKFTEAGRVTLRVQAHDEVAGKVRLRIEVEDTGKGLSEEARGKLFRAFEQTDSALSGVYGGTGLGLAISRRIVLAMHGTVSVGSELGRGTRIAVSVLLDPPASAAAAAADGAGTGTGAGAGRGDAGQARDGAPDGAPERAGDGARDGEAARVGSLAGTHLLVVDGQERTRSTTRQLAELWGMRARAVGTVEEGAALVLEAADRSDPYDVVMVDHSLDPQGVLKLARQVRADARLQHTRLVLLASGGLRGDAPRAQAAGFNAYIPKPVAAETLRACLQQLRAAGGGDTGDLITVHSMSERQPARRRVLVVDDNAINCKLAKILLERGGHEVAVASDGGEAVEMLGECPYDLILMDIEMPIVDGFEATRRIRHLDCAERAQTPIVAVTANAMTGDDARCLQLGMNGYLTKPIDGARLMSTVDTFARPLGAAA